MSKSVEPLLNAIKSAGEAALRLHEENKTLRAELGRLKEAERLLGAASLCVNDSLIGRGWHRQYAAYKLAAAKSPETAKLLSPKEYCLLLCAWKGGGPCLAEDCPRKED